MHFSGDLISKIEMGQRIATEEFTAACDRLPNLATGGALTELRGLMKEAIKNRALPGWFVDWPRKEAMARSLRWFELVAVPGLLQTEDYARAVLRTQVMATEEQVEDMVQARMERQSILTREHPPMFWVILDEGVLRRPVGGAEVMAGQLGCAEAAQTANDRPRRSRWRSGAQGMSGSVVMELPGLAAVAGHAGPALSAMRPTVGRSAAVEPAWPVCLSWIFGRLPSAVAGAGGVLVTPAPG